MTDIFFPQLKFVENIQLDHDLVLFVFCFLSVGVTVGTLVGVVILVTSLIVFLNV